MTATAFSYESGSLPDLSHRIGQLVTDRSPAAQWWVDLAGELDALASRLLTDSQNAWQALRAQITSDAPHLAAQLRRIEVEQDDLQFQVREVRILTGSQAGDPTGAGVVRSAVRDLLHRLRRYEERTDRVFHDAYRRDLGGE